MLFVNKSFFSCMVAACLVSHIALAKAVDVIRPEDEALLEGIFDLTTDASRKKHDKLWEDDKSIDVKGARDVSRVQAQPLANVKAEKSSDVTGDNATTPQMQENEEEIMVEIPEKNNLKDTMKTVAEGNNTQNVATSIEVPSILDDEKKQTSETKTIQHYNDEIRYTYPSKKERNDARQPLREWYDPNLNLKEDILTKTSAQPEIPDATLENFKTAISDCLDSRKSALDIDRSMLYRQNTYDAVAYLSQSFEEINRCYENVGYDIIDTYYQGNSMLKNSFMQKAKTFYLSGTDVNFSPRFCGENCSLNALVTAQMDKFAEFRTYLAQLLEERPSSSEVTNLKEFSETQKNPRDDIPEFMQYDDEDVPLIEEDDPVAYRPLPQGQNARPSVSHPSDAKDNTIDLPEIL